MGFLDRQWPSKRKLFLLPLTTLISMTSLWGSATDHRCFLDQENNIHPSTCILSKTFTPYGALSNRSLENYNLGFDPKNFEWNPQDLNAFFKTLRRRMQPKKSLFFQTQIGMGFLGYSGLKGNLFPRFINITNQVHFLNDYSIERGLSYNPVPFYEYTVGRRLTRWLNLGLSYQFQGGQTVQTKSLQESSLFSQFISNLQLNSIQGKVGFEFPIAIPIPQLFIAPIISLSTGVVWQSWTQTHLSLRQVGMPTVAYDLFFKPTIVASLAATGDLGFRFQNTSPYTPISFQLGCKFNYWGQVRNVGSLHKQGAYKFGMAKPFGLKAFYQWTPYLSVEWNFTPCWKSVSSYTLGKHCPRSWAPFFTRNTLFSKPKYVFTQTSVGLGDLTFIGTSGVLATTSKDSVHPTIKLKGPLTYNRTPLFEYQLGYRLLTWLNTSLNYQYQSQIKVTSDFFPGVPPNQSDNVPNHSIETTSQIQANLTLNALSLRIYLNSPWSFVWKKVASNIFMGGGLGASWQSWYNIRYLQNLRGRNTNTPISLQGITSPQNPKVVANVFPTADAGITFTSVYPNSPYTLQFGIKFNYWGAARHIINFKQAGSYKLIQNAWKINRIYQWAPYAGFQWNFPPKKYTYYPQKIKDHSIYRFFPFWVRIKQLESNQGPWVGFNVGKSFLFFDQVKGNFIATEGGLLASSLFAGTNAPLKGQLVFNSSPLYEYSLGYSLNPCLKLGIALQHQGGMTVQTKLLNLANLQTNNRPSDNRAFFSSNLSFNSMALKLYLCSPWPLVSLGVAVNPYIACGGGYGFQTWNQTQVNYTSLVFNTVLENEWLGYVYQFKQTFCGNVLATGDAGLLFQSAKPHSMFSLRLGCRFNYWGQARNIGALNKQGTVKIGFFKSFSIRGIYQAAPYGGVEWTF